MKLRRLAFLLAAAALGLMLCCPWAAALEEPESSDSYVFRMKEPAVMPLNAAYGIQSVPYAEGYYTADSLEDLQPLLDAGLVEIAVPDATLELLTDDQAPELEPLTDPMAEQQWYLDALGMEAVREAGLDGSGVTVAVIDSGMVQGHEDLSYDRVSGYNFLGAQGYADPTDWADDTGHGSLVGGILAARTDNDIGVAGLADGVELLVLRCFASSDNGTTNAGSGSVSTILSALEYAIDQGADVINMSFGGTNQESLAILESVLQRAADQGILLVAAAGNDGNGTYRYPAAFDCVIGVGAVDQSGGLYSRSQRNDSVFVSAPGVDIYGIGYTGANAYRSDTGTSMAAPMVSALAALAKQTDRALDQSDFQALLQASVTDAGEAGYDTGYGWGSISASAFVQALTAPQPIDYRCGEGELPAEVDWSTSYTIGKGDQVILPTPVRTEYDFAGWYLTEDYTGPAVTEIPAGSVGTVTLYAGWTEHQEPEPGSPAVVEGQEHQTGSASPASLDGLTAAQPYEADVASWFTGAESYEISVAPSIGLAELEGSKLTYTPNAEAAGQTADLSLRGRSGELTSEAVTVSVAVSSLPVSNAVLTTQKVEYDLYRQTAGASVGMHLYGNRLTGITADGTPLTAGTDYLLEGETVQLSHAFLKGLGTGSHTLSFTFDNGRTDTDKQASLPVSIVDSTPVTPPDPGSGGGGGGGGGGTMVAEEPALELLKTKDAEFYYALENGTARISFEKDELNRLADQPLVCLDLSQVKEVQTVSIAGEDLAALEDGSLKLLLPNGGVLLPVGEAKRLGTELGQGRLEVTIVLAAERSDSERKSVGSGPIYEVSFQMVGQSVQELDQAVTLLLPYAKETVGSVPQMARLDTDGSLLMLETRWEMPFQAAEISRPGRYVLIDLPWTNPFTDVVESDWFYSAVQSVCTRGIMEGTSDHAFSPLTPVTRGMMVTILYRLEGAPAVAEPGQFGDISGGEWYADAANWAAAQGIVTGYGDGTFRPGDPITRQQMAAILYRYTQYKGLETENRADLSGYADADQIDDWAAAALQWCNAEGLIQGTDGTRLDPDGTANRAQVAMILTRYCNSDH